MSTTNSRGKFRNKRTTPFTMLSNAMLRNPALSLKAKGLLAVMLTFPDDWDYHMSHIEKQSKDGKDGHGSALKELLDFGYVRRLRLKDDKGRFAGYDYEVTDEGWENPECVKSSTNGFSVSGETVSGKPATTNTEDTKTDLTNTYLKDGAGKLRGSDGSPERQAGGQEKALAPSQHPDSADTQAGQENGLAKSGVEVPPALAAAPGFAEAWAEWLAYRRERRLTTSARTLQSQLRNLEKWGRPAEVIEQSISNGWAGLFALKGERAGKPQTMQDANEQLMSRAADTMTALKGVFDE